MTTEDEADATAEVLDGLIDRIRIGIPIGERVIPAYNFSYGAVQDLLELYIQKANEAGYSDTEAWENFSLLKNSFFVPIDNTPGLPRLVDFAQALVSVPPEVIATARGSTVNDIKEHWLGKLRNGRKVLAVSHSQGGMFVSFR